MRPWTIAAAAGLILAAAGVVSFYALTREDSSFDSNVSAYSVSDDGYTLTLTASSGACGQVVSARAEESPSRVRVLVRATDPRGCGELVATNRQAKVRLKAPLGTRLVVNSHGYPIINSPPTAAMNPP